MVCGYSNKGIVSSVCNDSKTEYIITNTSTDTPKKNSHVKTGDTTRINHWVTLLTVSGLFLIVLGRLFRHEKD